MQTNKQNIGQVTKLSHFIQKYPNQEIHKQFKLLEQSFPSHRIIKGDGNCFYRAFAFLYLASTPFQNQHDVFPKVQWNYRKDNSWISSNQQFQYEMHNLWTKFIKQLSNIQSKYQKQKKLQKLLNTFPTLDELIIGYFRSLNYQHLVKEKNNFMPYFKNEAQFQNQLDRISTFGEQSEGVQIYSLCHAMKIKITVFFVDENNFQPIEYMENMEDKGLFLFYRPGHYDIVYPFETEDQHSQQPKGFWSNIKTSFINKPKPAKSELIRVANPDLRNKKQQRMNESKVDSSKVSPPGTSEIKNNSDKNTAEHASTYFRSSISSQNGRYDMKFAPANYQLGQNNSTSTIQSSLKQTDTNSNRNKRKPIVITSWTDPLQRVSMEALGLGGIGLLGYLMYNYFYA